MADISVIIPCYNVVSYIDRCLTSLAMQTIGIDALEIICIDDASTDDTWEYLKSWEQRFPENILLVHCDENGRQGTARNIGLQYASTEWIAFIDSDDWVELDYFEMLFSIAHQRNFDIIACQNDRDFSTELTFFTDRSTEAESRALLIDTVEKRKTFLFMWNMGSLAWGKLIRRDFLTENQIYFPENLTYEDTFWGCLLHLYAERIFFLEEKLYHYFVNQNSTVLLKDADYHTDLLTVQLMLWSELQVRNFYPLYREELEYNFLLYCYFGFLKIIAYRFETPSYSLFRLLREIVVERIPDYRSNIYIQQNVLSEFQLILLKFLLKPMNRTQFPELIASIKQFGL